MEKSVMKGEVLWNAIGRNEIQERNPTGCGPAAKRASVIAAAIIGVFLLVGSVVSPAYAQSSYPNKPIHFIVPFPAGSTSDVPSRVATDYLSQRLGQPIVVENRAGAGGNAGSAYAAKAKPDGYTLSMGSLHMSISPGIYKKLNYDPANDFASISMMTEFPIVAIVRPDHPSNNLKEFMEYAKAKSGKINWGTGGIGVLPHLGGELINMLVGKNNMVAVPYKSSPEAVTGMLGGETEMVMCGIASALPYAQKGNAKVKVIAVSSKERVPWLPDAPTGNEVGIKEFILPNWQNILAPAGTPRDIINRLNAEWVKIVADPGFKKKMLDLGFLAVATTPEEGDAIIKRDIALYGKIIKAAKVPTVD
jgi:tripartite-type tricarboxylate transporter receptor subunit TctC